MIQVKGNPTKQEAETITSIWQTGLWNSHIHCDRYPLDDNRFIFMFKVRIEYTLAKILKFKKDIVN